MGIGASGIGLFPAIFSNRINVLPNNALQKSHINQRRKDYWNLWSNHCEKPLGTITVINTLLSPLPIPTLCFLLTRGLHYRALLLPKGEAVCISEPHSSLRLIQPDKTVLRITEMEGPSKQAGSPHFPGGSRFCLVILFFWIAKSLHTEAKSLLGFHGCSPATFSV